MSHFTDKHRSDLKLLLDSRVQSIKSTLPKYGDAYQKRIVENIQRPFDAFLEKVESIRSSGRYSPGGERAELRLAARAMQDTYAAVRAETVGKLESQLAEQRAAALAPKKPTTDPVLLLLKELRDREMRDELRELDPLTLHTRIRQAVNDGADTNLLDALEGAPPGFPIAPAALIQETRDAIALKNHPELGELAQLRDAYTYALGVVDQTLVAATGLTPLEIASDPTPAPRRQPAGQAV